jgi:hypothetical protein
MRGEGDSGSLGGPSGNLFITLSVKAHEFFQRRGDDIIYELPLNFVQATLGDEVEVPSLVGKTKIKIPSGSQKSARLKAGHRHLNKAGADQLGPGPENSTINSASNKGMGTATAVTAPRDNGKLIDGADIWRDKKERDLAQTLNILWPVYIAARHAVYKNSA